MAQIESILTKEEKTLHWGEGEWCNEPDFVKFNHAGFNCFVQRIMFPEFDGSLFGGYLCGYIIIPETHPWYNKSIEEIPTGIDCHGGITFAGIKEGIEGSTYSIGFDCCHSGDLSPSYEQLKIKPEFYEWRQREEAFKNKYENICPILFKKTYRNIEFCIDQCKSVAEQAQKAEK